MPETKEQLIKRIKALEAQLDRELSADLPFNTTMYSLKRAKAELGNQLVFEALTEDEG